MVVCERRGSETEFHNNVADPDRRTAGYFGNKFLWQDQHAKVLAPMGIVIPKLKTEWQFGPVVLA
jgi:hypothetical protein